MSGIVLLVTFLATVASSSPAIPYVAVGACPFECCGYGQWTAVTPLRAYARERDKGRVAFTIKKGEKFRAITGNVHILRPGIVKVLEAFAEGDDTLRVTFAAGDTIWLLDYVGEGGQNIWYGDRVRTIDVDDWDWSQLEARTAPPPAKLIREPRAEWWVQVQNQRGQTGWILIPPEGLPDGADGCG